jgi:tripartite-type tricarboxylate transporter receptor subunit TctC
VKLWSLRACLSLALAAVASHAAAQTFPSRPLTFVMPYAAGGPGDTITRVFAEAMQKTLGQQILVENIAGASGTIGTARVARAAPDGHTLLMIHVSHATNGAMYKNLPYNAETDFEPVGRATSGPMLVVARNGFPAKDFAEFVSLVKADPSKVSLAHAGVGSASHLCGLMLSSALGVQMNEIPYKGTGPALSDLMGGQVDILCDQTSGTVPPVKASKIKAYAAAGKARIPSLPQLPSTGESGLPGVDINISFGLYAPKGTPKPVLETLTAALRKAVSDPDVRNRLESMGISAVPPELASPEALRTHFRSEVDTLGSLLIKAGVKAN